MKLEQMTIKELLDTSHTIAEKLFDGQVYPWEVLPNIGAFIEEIGPILPETEYKKVGKNIWIHRSAKIAPTIAMGGPMIICGRGTPECIFKGPRHHRRGRCYRQFL